MKPDRLKIERVGVFLRPNKPELKDEFESLKNSFEVFGVETLIDKKSAEMIGMTNGVEHSEMVDQVDILVALGGDGTLLSTARKSFHHSRPILPINAGNLGFLVDLKPEMANRFIPKLSRGEYEIERRSFLRIELENREPIYALNDILITHAKRMKMSRVQVYRRVENGIRKILNNYYGDALIISTPTGSTAYNLSSGGPILYPDMHSYILTPIAPHSLTQRPLVLPSQIEIDIVMEKSDGILTIDGQDVIKLNRGEFVKIAIHEQPIEIIRVKDYNFFETLREKLKWGGEE